MVTVTWLIIARHSLGHPLFMVAVIPTKSPASLLTFICRARTWLPVLRQIVSICSVSQRTVLFGVILNVRPCRTVGLVTHHTDL